MTRALMGIYRQPSSAATRILWGWNLAVLPWFVVSRVLSGAAFVTGLFAVGEGATQTGLVGVFLALVAASLSAYKIWTSEKEKRGEREEKSEFTKGLLKEISSLRKQVILLQIRLDRRRGGEGGEGCDSEIIPLPPPSTPPPKPRRGKG